MSLHSEIGFLVWLLYFIAECRKMQPFYTAILRSPAQWCNGFNYLLLFIYLFIYFIYYVIIYFSIPLFIYLYILTSILVIIFLYTTVVWEVYLFPLLQAVFENACDLIYIVHLPHYFLQSRPGFMAAPCLIIIVCFQSTNSFTSKRHGNYQRRLNDDVWLHILCIDSLGHVGYNILFRGWRRRQPGWVSWKMRNHGNTNIDNDIWTIIFGGIFYKGYRS